MPFSSRPYANRYIPSNRFPEGLKWLLIVNISIFVLSTILQNRVNLFDRMALVPVEVVRGGAVWELFTYMFQHAGFSQILWNMLGLWMFGAPLERTWGTNKFLRFYLTTGVAAGLTVVVATYIFGGTTIPTEGSSGALYAILMAYALAFPDQTLFFNFLIPIKSKYLVMILGAIVFLQSFTATFGRQTGSVPVIASLGGLIAGYLMLRGRTLRKQLRSPVVSTYQSWKLRRAKKKFEVYLRRTGGRPGGSGRNRPM